MTFSHRRFLPDRFRPRTPRQRSRRRLFLPMVALTLGLLLAPLWKVQSVEVHGGDVVPDSVAASLEGLVGHMVPTLRLDWLHQVAATWPAASEVRVHLELPGTVVVEIFPETPRGSVPVGSGWHAVALDGRLAGQIDGPYPPELVGFSRPSDRRLAFLVARRIAEGSGGEVTAVHHVTPADYLVGLWFEGPDRSTTIHVIPEGTAAETAWCEQVMNGGVMVEWADLRWPHRMVLRAGVSQEFRRPLFGNARGAAA
jgi:hypothetical protein